MAQRWKYNGIELNESLGLNLYEMDMRQYDPAISRWVVIDPVDHYEYSTYSSFDNNPIFLADPSGADSEPMSTIKFTEIMVGKKSNKDQFNYLSSTVVNDEGKIIDHRDDGDSNIYLKDRDGRIIGKEREGAEYHEGGYLELADLNSSANSNLPNEFKLKLSNLDIDMTLNYLSLGEILSGGGLIKYSKWINKIKLFKFGSRIRANNLKELKSLIRKLSKHGAPDISQKELRQLEKLVKKFGGNVRKDLNPVKKALGRLDPHVQVEGLGKSVESRKIFLKKG